jgi:lipopolysaccharide export system ATP-binding protein
MIPSSDLETLQAKGLIKVYNGRNVVNHVDLAIHRREILGLLGPNGAGKTTTFYMVMGLIRPDQGSILLDGQDITQDAMFLRARKGITYLAQEPSVFRKLTVEENILAILEWLPISREEMKERLKSLLAELGISHLAKQKASSLSGGERRRVEITRALVMEPRFMLLDEPFAGIDPLALNDINQIIKQLRDRGIGIIISDHNVRETLKICDLACIISEGKIIEKGSPQDIIQSKIAREVYLGDTFNL